MSSTAAQSFASGRILRLGTSCLVVLLVGCGPTETPEPPDGAGVEETTAHALESTSETPEPPDEAGAAETTGDALASTESQPAEMPSDGNPAGIEAGKVGGGEDSGRSSAPAGTDAVLSVLTPYEGSLPGADILSALAPDPAAVLLHISRDPDADSAARQNATRQLGVVGGTDARARLLQLLEDVGGDAGLRLAAVRGTEPRLATDDEFRTAVEGRLGDPVAAVARAAVLALRDVPVSHGRLVALSETEVAPQVRSALEVVLGLDSTTTPPVAVPLPAPERRGGR